MSAQVVEQVQAEILSLTEEEVEKNIQLHEQYPDIEMPVKQLDGKCYIGVLDVPDLGLSLPIMDSWSEKNSRIAPCRYKGSAYNNDLIIAGHNYNSHFGNLKNLAAGDLVVFTDMDGHRFEYEIVEMLVLDGTAIEEMIAGEWDLTLFTCTYGGQTRMTLRCELLP